MSPDIASFVKGLSSASGGAVVVDASQSYDLQVLTRHFHFETTNSPQASPNVSIVLDEPTRCHSRATILSPERVLPSIEHRLQTVSLPFIVVIDNFRGLTLLSKFPLSVFLHFPPPLMTVSRTTRQRALANELAKLNPRPSLDPATVNAIVALIAPDETFPPFMKHDALLHDFDASQKHIYHSNGYRRCVVRYFRERMEELGSDAKTTIELPKVPPTCTSVSGLQKHIDLYAVYSALNASYSFCSEYIQAHNEIGSPTYLAYTEAQEAQKAALAVPLVYDPTIWREWIRKYLDEHDTWENSGHGPVLGAWSAFYRRSGGDESLRSLYKANFTSIWQIAKECGYKVRTGFPVDGDDGDNGGDE
uniref:Uncharacterized protein n=1 Tax=Mycena chlorophos TaxID=658473 RepID=A0ABQ0LEV7_MYCCL|nr:predicted protein [Mycena chlorophos]